MPSPSAISSRAAASRRRMLEKRPTFSMPALMPRGLGLEALVAAEGVAEGDMDAAGATTSGGGASLLRAEERAEGAASSTTAVWWDCAVRAEGGALPLASLPPPDRPLSSRAEGFRLEASPRALAFEALLLNRESRGAARGSGATDSCDESIAALSVVIDKGNTPVMTSSHTLTVSPV